jgi:hypothetical protein
MRLIVIAVLGLAGCTVAEEMHACRRMCLPYRVETYERGQPETPSHPNTEVRCVCSKTEKIE